MLEDFATWKKELNLEISKQEEQCAKDNAIREKQKKRYQERNTQ